MTLRKPHHAASDDELIARAEAAVAALSSQFSDWMAAECDRLKTICRQLAADTTNADLTEKLRRAAHDMKSEATTFGFPVLERLATSLCHLIEETPGHGRVPLALVERHIAVLHIAHSIDREGNQLTHEIERMTAQYFTELNSAAELKKA